MAGRAAAILRAVTPTEGAFQRQVVTLARWKSWLVHAERAAVNRRGKWATPIQGYPGFPDLVLVRPPRIIFAELKRDAKGEPTPWQREWLRRLGLCPVETYVWRPTDMEEINRVLA